MPRMMNPDDRHEPYIQGVGSPLASLKDPLALPHSMISQSASESRSPTMAVVLTQSLLELVANEMAIEAVEADGALCRYYANTLAYIHGRSAVTGGGQDGSEGLAKQYADLQL